MGPVVKQRLRYASAAQQSIEHPVLGEPLTQNYFTVRTTYHNFTSFDLYIELQNKLELRIERHPNKNTGDLIVKEEYSFNFSQYNRLLEELSNNPDFDSHRSMAYRLYSFLRKIKYSPNMGGECSFVIQTIIRESEIEQFGSIYSHHLNVLIILPEYLNTVSHPFADVVSSVERYAEQKKRFAGNVIAIEVVSNDNEVGVRYAYILNKIVQIEPIVDFSRPSGVYIFRITKSDNQKNEIPAPEFYNFDEGFEECGLYKTVEEAFSGGDLASANAVRLKEAQLELETLKTENQRNNEIERQRERVHEHEMARMRQEATERERAHEQKIRQLNHEHNLLRENEEFRHRAEMAKLEKAAQERKSKSEMIKLASGIVTGAISVYVLMSKKKESK